MADEAEEILKFRDVTDVDEEQARTYLRAANNDLQVALHNFFGGHAMEEQEVINLDGDEDDDENEVPAGSKGPGATPNAEESKFKAANSRFQTVSSLNHDSSSDDEEGGQAFYAGGSLHSGQQVLGPRSRNQIVDDMFRSVKEHGGEVVNQEGGSTQQNALKFSGTGYRLGQTTNDTEVVSEAVGETSRGRQEVTITLKMWRQGFSVNNGPLRKYSEPNNVQFLKTVSRGLIPKELLLQAGQGNEVHLLMEDHSNEDYTLAKPKLKAFSGKGNVLGSPVPGVPLPSVQAPAAAATPTPDARAVCEARAREAVVVDASQPTTSVQIRLVDGSRLVGSFNHSHTLADLRTYIATARPEYAGTNFHLLTTFPSKELTDNTSTLSAAGILNAALLQRIG